uniref:Uncharacterized protein n=1 Tax=Rhizophora mucronata TaxID=61149 RepID=A0A2P2NI20_RHIMU
MNYYGICVHGFYVFKSIPQNKLQRMNRIHFIVLPRKTPCLDNFEKGLER